MCARAHLGPLEEPLIYECAAAAALCAGVVNF